MIERKGGLEAGKGRTEKRKSVRNEEKQHKEKEEEKKRKKRKER